MLAPLLADLGVLARAELDRSVEAHHHHRH